MSKCTQVYWGGCKMSVGSEDEGSEKSRSDAPKSSHSQRVVTVNEDRINSRDLFATARQIVIEHRSETYILRITAQNKLILTK